MKVVLKMFSVYDSKTESWGAPFVQKTANEAKRNFQEVVNDPKGMIGKYPEDYTLFELADWSENKGEIRPHGTPISHGLGVGYLRSEKTDTTSALKSAQ